MNCLNCKKEIIVRGKRKLTQKRCSSCYQNSRNKSHCLDCGIKLIHSKTRRCVKCFSESQKGEKSSSWKGGLPQCKLCFNKLSVYKNSKQYNTGICQKCYRGEVTKRWNKNLTFEQRELGRSINPKYITWRKAVFNRDHYTCILCGNKKGGELQADHIMPWAIFEKVRFDVLNGRTLCIECHRKTETYGNKTKQILIKIT